MCRGHGEEGNYVQKGLKFQNHLHCRAGPKEPGVRVHPSCHLPSHSSTFSHPTQTYHHPAQVHTAPPNPKPTKNPKSRSVPGPVFRSENDFRQKTRQKTMNRFRRIILSSLRNKSWTGEVESLFTILFIIEIFYGIGL